VGKPSRRAVPVPFVLLPFVLVSPDLDTIIGLFYAGRASLGQFVRVEADEMPEVYRALLAHEHHMTVTVEAHHGSPVDVRVLDRRVTPTHYARQIVLTRQRDGRVVQYGIMRVNLKWLDAEVRDEVRSERKPLGRILIERDVLRRIQLFSLWRIVPSPRLRELLELDTDAETVYGRTAMIECNGEPAIELLEIVK
jgi:chorismate-pyruvate lyase